MQYQLSFAPASSGDRDFGQTYGFVIEAESLSGTLSQWVGAQGQLIDGQGRMFNIQLGAGSSESSLHILPADGSEDREHVIVFVDGGLKVGAAVALAWPSNPYNPLAYKISYYGKI
ncbi:TPA: hypothetical protein QDZ75_003648 [Stenotrophomonas maltophilia]|nr:hypothetical protein [Stenotrophomonas maltophilia]